MQSLVRLFGLTRRFSHGSSRVRKRRHRLTQRRLEQLEPRLAMAVDVLLQPDVPGMTNWVTVLTSEGDSVFVQEVANSERDLFIANNSSFFPGGASPRVEVGNFSSRFDTLSVRSGERVSSTEIVYPLGRLKTDDRAVFAVQAVDFDLVDMRANVGLISGEIRLGAGDSLAFSNGGAGGTGLVLEYTWSRAGNPLTGNLDISFNDEGGNLVVQVEDREGVNLFRNYDEPLLVSLSVRDADGDTEVSWSNELGSAPVVPLLPEDGIAPGNRTFIQIPELVANSGYQYVPGTLSGAFELATAGKPRFTFQIESADYGQDFDSQALGEAVPISFGEDRASEVRYTHQAVLPTGLQRQQVYIITGTFNTFTGIITFRTQLQTGAGQVGGGNTGGGVTGGTTTTSRTEPVQLPIYLKPTLRLNGDTQPSYLFGGRRFNDKAPTDFTLFDGHTFTAGLVAEMVNPRSAISIESPVVTVGASGGLGMVSLAATEVDINAPLRASRSLTVPAARDTAAVWTELWDHDGDGNGDYPTPMIARDDGTVTERLTFNAIVSSNAFELQLAEDPEVLVADPSSGAWGRSQFLVSQTGSMSNLTDVLNLPPQTLPPAASIFVEVDDGDIFLEGRAVGTDQSYFLRSPRGSELEAPFMLTTESRLTGAPTGRIEGDTVAVTLANDSFGESYDSYAKSIVTLDTDVERLRVQAAFRGPYEGVGADPIEFPFNYDLKIREQNDLIVDAFAANSGKVDFEVGGGLDLLATIQVDNGDVEISAGQGFTVQSPIQVAFGAISVTAPTLVVRNTVRVLRALQDEAIPDVTLTATAGPLLLDDAVAGLNRVVLESRGFGADISGSGRVACDVVDMRVDDNRGGGDIDLRTDANLVRVRARGETRLDERDTAAFEVRESREVTLLAAGYDVLDPVPFGPGVSPAIYADVYDTEVLTVSAPNGSVDVRHFGDVSPVIGNLQNIRSGTEDRMTAAGSVSIVSDIGSQVTVYDAPFAAGGAVDVKVATSSRLPGTFQPPNSGEEGVRPAYIFSTIAVTQSGQLAALDGIEPRELLPGDRVLVKDGVGSTGEGGKANGIYVLLTKRYDTAGNVALTLVRDSRYDTTVEAGERFHVRVTDGGSGGQNVGKLFVGMGFVFDPSRGDIPLVATETQPRQGHVSVTATAVTNDLQAQFQAGSSFFDDTITAVNEGGIRSNGNRLLFDDVLLRTGDLVLIRNPIVEYNQDGGRVGGVVDRSVGIYEVERQGRTENQESGVTGDKWMLRRWAGVNEDGFDFGMYPPGTLDPVYEGIVAVNDGSLRTARTGLMYALNFRALNQTSLNIEQAEPPGGYDNIPLGTESPYHWQNIETKNPAGSLSFVVSTENGVNEATGSFGRMLNLAQSNGEFIGRDTIDHTTVVTFDSQVRSIELDQALPAIVDPLQITPGSRVLLEGSEVQENNIGQRVRRGLEYFFTGPSRPSQVKTARRLVRGAVTSLEEVHGLEVAANGVTISNFRIGGFTSGAAIFVNGGENTLIENVIVGRSDDAGGSRLPNRYGIDVVQSAVGTGQYTTVLNSTIVASEEIGVRFHTGSHGVRLVGTTIGQPLASNKTGILVDSEESREHLIGALPIPVAALVAKGSRFRENVLTVEAADGDADTLADLVKNLYLGQTILMGSSGILPGDARIASISFENGKLTIGLTRSILRTVSADIPLAFTAPPRNTVQNNQDNIVIKSGSARIVGTDVLNAVFDGIRVEGNKVSDGVGLSPNGTITIGGGLDGQTRELSADHVTVHSNQQAGIRFGAAMFKHIDPVPGGSLQDKYDFLKAHVIIAGNYLGTNRSGASGLGNGYYGESDFVVGGERALDGTPADPGRTLLQDRFRDNPEPGTNPRDSSGRYKALYRPEDFAAFGDVGFDREGNFHGGGNLGGGDPPPLDPDPPVAW